MSQMDTRNGEQRFAYGHAWLTANEIEEVEAMDAKIAARKIATRLLIFAPSAGATEMQTFQANLWASALMAD